MHAFARRTTAALAAFAIPGLLAACKDAGDSEAPAPATTKETPAGFTDVTRELGLTFVHDAGLDGSFFMAEIMGSGLALFDHDGDGDLDIYLVQAGQRDGSTPDLHNRLYSQERDGRFVDRTAESGLGDAGYGMGTALGDIDNDGDLDLFVSNYGADVLYRNDGGGRFTDITAEAGISGERWSTSACFLDYDQDGWLDLYVTNYVQAEPARDCTDSAGRKEYCGPLTYPGVADALWQNREGTSFVDVAERTGVAAGRGRGLGVVSADLDQNGALDIFVANDGEANNLWTLGADGRMEDQAIIMGVAVNSFGKPEASMGIALGDLNDDRRLDLYVTHLVRETNTLYTGSTFSMRDSTGLTGSGPDTMRYTGFGTAFFDADHDGDLDLAVANGRVTRGDAGPADGADPGNALEGTYGEPDLYYANLGGGRLENACDAAGDLCRKAHVGRGLATGDIDGDGDLDVVVSNGHGPPRLLRNDLPDKQNWLQLRAVDPDLGRDAIGAVVEVTTDERRMIRPVTTCYSYLTASEPILHFGLASAQRATEVSVTWPDGTVERFGEVEANQRVTLRRGSGEALP